MKNKFKILVLILIFIVVSYYFFKVVKINTFKENVLYSEKDIKEYSSYVNKSDTYLTRDEAIKKGLSLFEKGFKIDLNRDKLNEVIALIDIGNDSKWNIIWIDTENKSKYYISIAVNTGKVLVASSMQYEKEEQKNTNILTKDEALTLINPLLKEINVNTDNEDFDVTINFTVYNDYNIIVKPKLGGEFFKVTLDHKSKKPVEFFRF